MHPERQPLSEVYILLPELKVERRGKAAALKFKTTVENAVKACYNKTVINVSGERP